MPRTLQKMKVIPSNAAFCKKHITMGITMAFRWFSSSSLTVSTKAPITTGITVVLTAPVIASPGILVLVILVPVQVPSIMFWSPGTAILMILQSLLSLLITTISSPQSSISLSVWIAKSQIFYIPHSPALALVDARTVCLHIQFQISCTGVNVLFFSSFAVSLPALVSR